MILFAKDPVDHLPCAVCEKESRSHASALGVRNAESRLNLRDIRVIAQLSDIGTGVNEPADKDHGNVFIQNFFHDKPKFCIL